MQNAYAGSRWGSFVATKFKSIRNINRSIATRPQVLFLGAGIRSCSFQVFFSFTLYGGICSFDVFFPRRLCGAICSFDVCVFVILPTGGILLLWFLYWIWPPSVKSSLFFFNIFSNKVILLLGVFVGTLLQSLPRLQDGPLLWPSANFCNTHSRLSAKVMTLDWMMCRFVWAFYKQLLSLLVRDEVGLFKRLPRERSAYLHAGH